MKHLTLFLSICWIFWFSQIFAISTICGLSDVPAATVISLVSNTSQLVGDKFEDSEEFLSVVLSDSNSSSSNLVKIEKQNSENDFIIVSEIRNIESENVLSENISANNYDKSNIDDFKQTSNIEIIEKYQDKKEETVVKEILKEQVIISETHQSSSQDTINVSEVNLTIEENPIPVFSEWAQKQMEEAEKKLEKQVVNSSSSKKNATGGNKPIPVKLRVKNYASPDCGAKIIASNTEAQNTGALLTSSKDEYMLSPCTSRIWFVIELCEAIQLEKVELANFELFSSSPKNFSVTVSNRFPTREWSNVGRFIAEDNRNIQSFDLFPHLFGKFVRVDVHSHYNSEHFCPISLFHVYGTSEFEAFETENRQHTDDLDEYDDDFSNDQPNNSKNENNLFKSASDAVMSIVKKAAEVLVKKNLNKTRNSCDADLNSFESKCVSMKKNFTCEKCNQSFVNRINYLVSCKYSQLNNLLKVESLEKAMKSNMCEKIINKLSSCSNINIENCIHYTDGENLNNRKNFLFNILPVCYQVALCYLNNNLTKIKSNESNYISDKNEHFNLTIKKNSENDFLQTESLIGRSHKQASSTKVEHAVNSSIESVVKQKSSETENVETFEQEIHNNENDEPTQILEPPILSATEQQKNDKEEISITENVNIFNLVDKSNTETSEKQHSTTQEDDKKYQKSSNTLSVKLEEQKETDNEQTTTWEDNIDKIFSEQGVSPDNVNSNLNNGGESIESQTVQKVQSESIFIRLSNRIKALERNMSLSGQYLEELSRRYKKQVEELQHSFSKTLSAIEEQNRNAIERENSLTQQNEKLKENVIELTIRLNSCISLIVCLMILQFVILWFYLRSYRHQYSQIVQRIEEDSSFNTKRAVKKIKKLNRRKSIESVVEQTVPAKKQRRPSEEAMRITGSYKDLLILENQEIKDREFSKEISFQLNNNNKKTTKQRQRKISVFYGKTKDNEQNSIKSSQTAKYERLESVSEDLTNSSIASTVTSTLQNEKLILNEDYESYVPGTDLAYNEFMPDGPSGEKNRISNDSITPLMNVKQKKMGKIRKLSSPKFLKFTKHDNKKLAHGPTGWEWYRSKKPNTDNNDNNKITTSNIETNKKIPLTPDRLENINGFLSSSTNSSISEMMIRTTNSKGSDDSIHISDNPVTPTINSYLKNGNSSKKQSSFRKILKKVF